ncbi:MAG: nucleotide exchange factor GrpE [Synergistaceae bacterium]|jgi:molecular chaperone GrpE|nr:nucleotide exchange factor GrpE [Synergistaceae bacterium]
MPERTIDDREAPGARNENNGLERETEGKVEIEPEGEKAATADSDAPETGEANGEVENEVENEMENEVENLKNQLAAARADLYNYRQRVERDRAKARKLIAEDKTADFLPVLDNLDRALLVPENGTAKDVLVGVRMVQRQFLSVLENSGVTAIPAEGRFDPLQHEAVETEFVDDPARDGIVLRELLRGYRTPDRILRPAQVRVGKLRAPQSEQ